MNKIIILLALAALTPLACKQKTEPTPQAATNEPFVCKPPLRFAPTAAPQDTYMVLGSFQPRGAGVPASSHTFAVFCKCEGDKIVESRTISWMPQTLDIKVLKRDPEQGVNLTYKQTYDIAAKNGYTLFFRGPYKVEPELYRKACEQATELESGKVLYKAGDGATRPHAVNCIHAVADIDREYGYLKTGANWGSSATSIVEKHLFRWVIQDKKDNSWLIGKIQADIGK